MKELLTNWIVNLTLFSVLSSLTGKLLPGKTYTPYIRIFCGIMMILTLLQPVLSLSGIEDSIDLRVTQELYETEIRQMEKFFKQIEEEQKEELEKRYQEYLKEQEDGVEKEDN